MKEPSLSKEVSSRKPEIKHQQIRIINPNSRQLSLPSEAFLDIWFIDNDIVIGGFGWYEYFEYHKLQKMKPLEAEE